MTKTRHRNNSYAETLDFIFAQLPMYQRQGKSAFKKDLTNIIALCQFLGNPHKKIKAIHVAGTNGKGSTSHIIASILQEYGYKVALYTSPHYMDFRERVKINGTLMPKAYVIDFVHRIKPALNNIQASFFEITVAMAFDYFAKENVDYAVIETGLGGRLDSTNIIDPLLSVITNISLDHVSMLGNTIQKIAAEKAGIIKAGKPVVIGVKARETDFIFENKARELGAKLSYAADITQKVEIDRYLNLMPNPAPFHFENIRTAVAATSLLLDTLSQSYDERLVSRGIKFLKENTYYIGRWEILNNKPLVIADSAHNEAGLRIVIKKVQEEQRGKLHVVLGFVIDKDVDSILSLFPINAKYYFAKANIPRGLNADTLRIKARGLNLQGRSYVSVKNALQAALRNASNNDTIFMGGSIFVVAEVLSYFKTFKRS